MLFCPYCATLLLLEQVDGLRLYCNICGYRCGITEDITVRTEMKNRPVFDLLSEGGAWRHATKVTAQCKSVECDGDNAYFFEVQTRTAEEPKTKFFKCVSCSHRWREM
eukprot:TRINITY_DN13493_c0_g1_i1.p1 TRINITY_DN13493_c0_g1~~TRINITY_DN13493_c0_g1_i1.p1  ORF type:complete len:108 (+),score=27.55 TRINITY_DN13493_c0_g1_i1:60-383(+)